jgi:quercetin dioxygenase-like cupin family protein
MATAPKTQLSGQDPVKVDSKHYKVEFENDRVRVLRVKYGPKEKSVMHGHPQTIGVFLKEGRAKFTKPDGKSEERSWTTGQVLHMPAEQHLPENISGKPIELVLIELK